MRDYFKQILEETYETFGARQCENMDDEQYTRLLDKLVFVSSFYPYIPEEEQQSIINKRLLTDKEYKNINARLISTWLEQDGKIFYKEVSQEPTKLFEPVTEERKEYWIEEWKKVLSQIETNFSVNTEERKGSGSRLRENLEGAGIMAHVPPSAQQSEPIENTFFCVMPNQCKNQCARCLAESEIVNSKLEDKNV